MRVTIIRIDRERAEKNPPTGGCMPRTGFEPARVASLPPQSSASANSATWAHCLNLSGELYARVSACRERNPAAGGDDEQAAGGLGVDFVPAGEGAERGEDRAALVEDET